MTVDRQVFIQHAKVLGNGVELVLSILAAGFLVLFSAAQLDTRPPMRIIESDTHVTTADDGRSFFVRRRTCYDREGIPGNGLPRLVGAGNDLLVPLPSKALSALPGCNVYNVLVRIPHEVPAGEYTYRITYRFEVNPFKTIEIQAPPVGVTVVKK